jgi:Mrp family chromosome partitioning ATPase
MSSLDKAFIRAYAERFASALGRPGVSTPQLVETHRPCPAGDNRGSKDTTAVSSTEATGPAVTSTTSTAQPAVVEQTVSGTTHRSEPVRPQWEVDAFRWTPTCTRLLASRGEDFSRVALHIAKIAQSGKRVLAVTSFGRGEGCTSLVLCLARQLAASQVETAVVDADFQNPQIAGQLGLSVACGWESVVAGRTPAGEVAIVSLADRLTVFPWCAPEGSDPSATEPRVDATLARISASYEVVLVDAGPVFSAVRRLLRVPAGNPIQGALAIRDRRSTTDHQLAELIGRLEGHGIPVIGVAENFVAQPRVA